MRSIHIPKRFQDVYPGWWVALGGMFSILLLNGVQSGGSMGLFFVSLLRQFGWSRTLISGAFTLVRLENSILGPLEGYLTDKYGAHWMVFFGFLIAASGFIVLGLVNQPMTFYISMILITTGTGVGGFVAVAAAVNWWFNRRRNRAMGVATSAFGLAAVLGIPVAWGINTFGWRYTAFAIGVILILTSYPMSQIMRLRPSDPNPDPPHQTKSNQDEPSIILNQDFTVRQAMKTRAFWLIPLVHSFTAFTNTAVNVHGIPHLVDVGLTTSMAAVALATYGIVEWFWRIGASPIGDWVDKRYVISVHCILQALGATILGFTRSMHTAIIFAVIFGIGHGGRGPPLHAIRGEYFGRKHFATIMGIGSLISSVSGFITPLLLGYLYDVQGTYLWGFLGMSAVTLSGAVIILFATKPRLPIVQTDDGN